MFVFSIWIDIDNNARFVLNWDWVELTNNKNSHANWQFSSKKYNSEWLYISWDKTVPIFVLWYVSLSNFDFARLCVAVPEVVDLFLYQNGDEMMMHSLVCSVSASMNIKTRRKRKRVMISAPFIDNWIITGSWYYRQLINYH